MDCLLLNLYLTISSLFICFVVSAASLESSGSLVCNKNTSQAQNCETFALLFTNSYYSSLFNLSFYLGINKSTIAEVNSFSSANHTDSLPINHPLLIPIECNCINGGFFQAKLTKTTIHGESLSSIVESLEGLTSYQAIEANNPGISGWNLGKNLKLQIPLKCACSESGLLLVTYPVRKGDTIPNLAVTFNVTSESILSVNNQSFPNFKPEKLLPFSSILIPLNNKPIIPSEPNSHFAPPKKKKKKPKMRKFGWYLALAGSTLVIGITIATTFVVIKMMKKKKEENLRKGGDLELQQLSLSVRTTSDKKVSFEGSDPNPLDNQGIEANPCKILIEKYTVEEIRRATEDFNSCNHIEGFVFHGRLNGKNLAIKKTQQDIISRLEFRLLYDAIHHRPNIITLLGTCLNEGSSDSYLVFEYAKNGSLKDWLHGGLAMKNHFIASCYCFLTWSQRLKICLDVAVALQYMHHIMNPAYIHHNIKSRNIFLDEEFNAKIGNFGMAKCVQDDNSQSGCYLAPEFAHQGIVSPSMDVFAYGVVLLEVLSGKCPVLSGENEKGLCEQIKSIMPSESACEVALLKEWMDRALGENYSIEGALSLASLARDCIEENHSLRPSAGEIVEKLSRLVEELPEKDHHGLISESSCKPLVLAAANNL